MLFRGILLIWRFEVTGWPLAKDCSMIFPAKPHWFPFATLTLRCVVGTHTHFPPLPCPMVACTGITEANSATKFIANTCNIYTCRMQGVETVVRCLYMFVFIMCIICVYIVSISNIRRLLVAGKVREIGKDGLRMD